MKTPHYGVFTHALFHHRSANHLSHVRHPFPDVSFFFFYIGKETQHHASARRCDFFPRRHTTKFFTRTGAWRGRWGHSNRQRAWEWGGSTARTWEAWGEHENSAEVEVRENKQIHTSMNMARERKEKKMGIQSFKCFDHETKHTHKHERTHTHQ